MRKLNFLLAVIVLMTASACSSKKQQEVEVSLATLTVQGNCEMCKTTIEKAAQSEEGVVFAEWNGESKELHLQFDAGKTSVESISRAVAKAGYDTEKNKGDNVAYEALSPCCRYR